MATVFKYIKALIPINMFNGALWMEEEDIVKIPQALFNSSDIQAAITANHLIEVTENDLPVDVVSPTLKLKGEWDPSNGQLPIGRRIGDTYKINANGTGAHSALEPGMRVIFTSLNEYEISGSGATGGGSGLTDAPSDGSTYGRKDGAWAVIPAGGGGSGGLQTTPWDPTTNALPTGAQPGYMYRVSTKGIYAGLHFVPEDIMMIMPNGTDVTNLTNGVYSNVISGGYASISPTSNLSAVYPGSNYTLTNNNRTLETKTTFQTQYGWTSTVVAETATNINIEVLIERFYDSVDFNATGASSTFSFMFLTTTADTTMVDLLVANDFSYTLFSLGKNSSGYTLGGQNISAGTNVGAVSYSVPEGFEIVPGVTRLNFLYDVATRAVTVKLNGTTLVPVSGSLVIPTPPAQYPSIKFLCTTTANAAAYTADTARVLVNFGQAPFTNPELEHTGYVIPDTVEFEGPLRTISTEWNASGGAWPSATPIPGDLYFSNSDGVVEGTNISKYQGVFFDGLGWKFLSPNRVSESMVWMGDWYSLSQSYMASFMPPAVEGHVYRIATEGAIKVSDFADNGGYPAAVIVDHFKAGTIIVYRGGKWDILVKPTFSTLVESDSEVYPTANFGSTSMGNSSIAMAGAGDYTSFGLGQGFKQYTEVEITCNNNTNYDLLIGFVRRASVPPQAHVLDDISQYGAGDYAVYFKRTTGELYIIGKTVGGADVGPTLLATAPKGEIERGDIINACYSTSENAFYFAVNGEALLSFSPSTYNLPVDGADNFTLYGYYLATSQAYGTVSYGYDYEDYYFNFRGVSAEHCNRYKFFNGAGSAVTFHKCYLTAAPGTVVNNSIRSDEAESEVRTLATAAIRSYLPAVELMGLIDSQSKVATGVGGPCRFSHSTGDTPYRYYMPPQPFCVTKGETDSYSDLRFGSKLLVPVMTTSELADGQESFIEFTLIAAGNTTSVGGHPSIKIRQVNQVGVIIGNISVAGGNTYQLPAPVNGYYELNLGFRFDLPFGNSGIEYINLYDEPTQAIITGSGFNISKSYILGQVWEFTLLVAVYGPALGSDSDYLWNHSTTFTTQDGNYSNSILALMESNPQQYPNYREVLKAHSTGSPGENDIFQAISTSFDSMYGPVGKFDTFILKGSKIVPLSKFSEMPTVEWGYVPVGPSLLNTEIKCINESYYNRNVLFKISDFSYQNTGALNCLIYLKECTNFDKYNKVRLTFMKDSLSPAVQDFEVTVIGPTTRSFYINRNTTRVIDIQLTGDTEEPVVFTDHGSAPVQFELSIPREEVVPVNTTDLDHFYAPCTMRLTSFSASTYTSSGEGHIYWAVENATSGGPAPGGTINQGSTFSSVVDSSLLVKKGDKVQLNTLNLGMNSSATGLKVVMSGYTI